MAGGKSVLVIGSSGSGKSTSIGNIPELGIKGLNASETMILNVLGKELPFRNSAKQYTVWDKEKNPEGHMVINSNPKAVYQWLQHINEKMPQIKNIVIDDNTHISSMEYMRRIFEDGWQKFNDISYFMTITANDVKKFRDDLYVFFLHHTTETGDGLLEAKQTKASTLGKVIDDKLSGYESLFTVVLKAVKKIDGDTIKYSFLTEDANSSCKTPFGLFSTKEIPNDLGFVRESLDCFYNGDCNEEKPIKVENTKKSK